VSLIDMTQFDRMVLDPTPDDHTVGPDAACAGVEGELRRRVPRPGATDPDREPCLEQWGLRA
jgi:hypothetical protein